MFGPSRRSVSALALAVLLAPVSPALAQEHQHSGGKLGTVNFETSCTPSAQEQFTIGMTLLHSFEFGPAITAFSAAELVDPACAIAEWGIAMARWGNPFAAMIRPPAQLQLGADAIAKAEKAGAKTPRERAYIAAAATLFADGTTVGQAERLAKYERAMAKLAADYPNDREATIFWALSLTASAAPSDKTYKNQLQAGAILEKLYPGQPNHPGITHYIIHSYDVPALADRAVDAAHRYAEIAPASAHALHMPSHTFTRVGAWEESIASNLASAESAREKKNMAETLHATDYLTYAYLQTGQDQKVRVIMNELPDIAAVFDPTKTVGAAPGSAGVFAISAIPARWVIEHRDWKAAAALTPTKPSAFPYAEAMTHFARALGASHTGALTDARASIDALTQIIADLKKAGEVYWTEQVTIQKDAASAFLLLAEGRKDEALSGMRAVATREDATEKNAVTPGPLVPARELLGDMLLELKQPAAALVEYRAVLKKEPNRFRAIYGAAKSAADSGDRTAATGYYTQLLKIAAKADQPGRAELVEARRAVAR